MHLYIDCFFPAVAFVVWVGISSPGVLRALLAGADQAVAILLPAVALWIFHQWAGGWISSIYTAIRDQIRSFWAPSPKAYFKQFGRLAFQLLPVFFLSFTIPYLIEQLFVDPPNNLEPVRDDIVTEVHTRMPSTVSISDEVQNAMTEQGYTSERAALIDRLKDLTFRDDFYFARFPVLFLGAELGDDFSLEETDPSSYVFPVGSTYDSEFNREIIYNLVRALVPCAANGTANPRLQVEGYASSEPFTHSGIVLSESLSDQLNIRLADERGREVERILQMAITEHSVNGRIDVEIVADYESLEQMEAYRQFNDRFGSLDELVVRPDEDFLYTRAAHIKVLELGGCEIA